MCARGPNGWVVNRLREGITAGFGVSGGKGGGGGDSSNFLSG